MCVIDWCGFTWQAFATLVTGFAAVGGAVFVGLRQHGLARAQAAIADRQARTAETSARLANLKLRADLFDKRMEVYLAVHTYLKASLSTNVDRIWDVTPKLNDELMRAKFLFSDAITSQLEQAIKDSDELHDTKLERNEAKISGENLEGLITALRPMRRNVRRQIAKLAEIMGEEMKLYSD